VPGKTANLEKEAVHIIAKSLQLYFGKMRCQKAIVNCMPAMCIGESLPFRPWVAF